MSKLLVIHVRFHDGRYHGAGDWPPSPARLFQAFLAGVGLGGPIASETQDVLRWLEELPAPEIFAPRHHRFTKGYTNFMPNNDLDAKGGDPGKIAGIRAGKTIRACLFDTSEPIRYVWKLQENDKSEANARKLISISEQLYQLGRGIDFAWAWGDVVSEVAFQDEIEEAEVVRHSPFDGNGGVSLQVPSAGSLKSLISRYEAGGHRFVPLKRGRTFSQTFAQPPKPRFSIVNYNSPRRFFLFELRKGDPKSAFHAFNLADAARLCMEVRDATVERLLSALPERSDEIQLSLVGKKPEGSYQNTSAGRIIIIPLPTIGMQHADMQIRRVAIEIGSACPLATDDILWAFSGLELGKGEPSVVLLPSEDRKMLFHYGHERPAKIWQTVTPMALSTRAARRRIDPSRKIEEAKKAKERFEEQSKAIASVIQSLRHAGRNPSGCVITAVQKEPLQLLGEMVNDFANHTRFSKEQLWHVEIRFPDAQQGPMILGDGRFSGLGLFAPVNE